MDISGPTNGEPLGFRFIKPYLAHLYYIAGGAPVEWMEAAKLVPRIAIARTDRGQANLIYDLMLLRVREAFGPLDGTEVAIEEQYDHAIIRFLNEGPLVKFNKLNDEKRVHPPNTKRSAGFYFQQYCLFDQCEESAAGLTIVVGYRMGVSLVDVIAQCQRGDHLEWAYTIPEPPAGHQFSLIAPPAPQSPPARTYTIAPRADDDETKKNANS